MSRIIKRDKREEVRNILIAHRTLVRMGKNINPKNKEGIKYLNSIAEYVINKAKKVNPLLPYYLITKKIS